MSLQYQLVFGLLVTELSIFFLLLIIPRSWWYRFVQYTEGLTKVSSLVRGFQWATIVAFTLVGLLFVDSVNSMVRADERVQKDQTGLKLEALRMKEFYAQRNFYLCGFVLFLSIVINRYFSLLLHTAALEKGIHQIAKKKE